MKQGLCVLVLGLAFSARAAVGGMIEAPLVYEAGQTFDAVLRMPETESLALVQVDVELSATEGVAGTDFGFADPPLTTGSLDRVFSSSSGVAFSLATDNGLQRLTLTDISASGPVDVIAGINDVLASLSVFTGSDFAGELELRVDPSTLIANQNATDGVSNLATLRVEAENSDVVILRIPEPSSVAIVLLGAASHTRLSLRRRRVLVTPTSADSVCPETLKAWSSQPVRPAD